MDESILYVTKQGTQLGVSDNQYIVRDLSTDNSEDGGPAILNNFPVKKIETICIFGTGVDVTSYARATANRNATVINYFTTNGGFRGRFVPNETTIAPLHRQQYELSEAEKSAISAQFVVGKIQNAIEYLRRKQIRSVVGKDLLDAPGKIQTCETMDELRGIEGAAAREYFDHFEDTLRDGWEMDRRTIRPPEDHTNSLLSLTYSFLRHEAESAIRQVNLDPYVGVFHTERHGRPALALDLMEEFRRGFADPFVARLVNRRTITHEQFTTENRLSDDAFDRYLSKYDSYMDESLHHATVGRTMTRREIIRMQAHLLRKRIVGDIEAYPPYRVDRR